MTVHGGADTEAGGETVLVLRVREEHLPRVLEALEGIDLGADEDDTAGFMVGSRLTGSVRATSVGGKSDTCTTDIGR